MIGMALRRDTRRHLISFLFILAITALAVWIVVPAHPHITWGPLQRDLNIKYGLDLRGGTQLTYRAAVDKNNVDQSWKLKRDFNFVFGKIDQFFNEATISAKDEIIFTFKKKTYTTISKVLIITK